MSMTRKFAIAAALAATTLPAAAQDFNGSPNFGTINLNAGFTPDPQVVSMRRISAGTAAASSRTRRMCA